MICGDLILLLRGNSVLEFVNLIFGGDSWILLIYFVLWEFVVSVNLLLGGGFLDFANVHVLEAFLDFANLLLGGNHSWNLSTYS